MQVGILKFILNNCCKAYVHTQIREAICLGIIFGTTIVLSGLKDHWMAPTMKVVASIALCGAAWDDFLCETADICGASPYVPQFTKDGQFIDKE